MQIIRPKDNDVASRSTLLTVVGILIAIFAAVGLLGSLFQFAYLMTSFDGSKDIENLARTGFHREGLTADKIKAILFMVAFVSMVIDLFCLWAAVAMVRRQEWGRTFYTIYCPIKIVADIGLIAIFIVAVGIGHGLTENENATHIAGQMSKILIALVGLHGLFYVFCMFLLTSKKIKKEFQPAWMR